MGKDNRLVEIFGDKARTEDQLVRISETALMRGPLGKTFFSNLTRPIGLEFEIEGVKGHMELALSSHKSIYWKAEQDGSLKDSGIELISLPVGGANIDYALQEMDTLLGSVSHRVKTSVRTSIHVHVDVSDFTSQQLFQLTAIYALFEKAFFSLQSANRQNNAFCYPVTECLPRHMGTAGSGKYCAFNLAPVENQLTVEFRHADFSPDMKQNRRWIQVVCKFMNFFGRHKLRLREIFENTVMNDDYLKLFNTVMGKSVVLFDMRAIEEQMKSNAVWATTLMESV